MLILYKNELYVYSANKKTLSRTSQEYNSYKAL